MNQRLPQLGEWQKDELKDKEIVYLIALSEGMDKGSTPTTQDLVDLQEHLDVEADAWMLDIDGRNTGVLSSYCAEETTGDCNASVTVVIDPQMRIQFLGATHERDGSSALDVLLGFFSE